MSALPIGSVTVKDADVFRRGLSDKVPADVRAGHAAPLATARRLSRRFAEQAEAYDRSGTINRDNIAALRRHGLTSLTVPRHLGGPDVPFAVLIDVISEVAQADPATALILAMQVLHTRAVALSTTWPEAVKDKVLRSIVEEGALINALRVEPELGSPTRGGIPATTAVRTADGWQLNGRKRYSTGSSELQWGIVWGAVQDGATPLIGEFLVPVRAKGVRFEATWDHLGLRASDSNDVIFENVDLPTEYAVDMRAPEAWKGKHEILAAWLPLLLSALYDGVARSAYAWVRNWVNSRTPSNLGAPLSAVPRIRQAVGEMAAFLETNAALLFLAKHQYDFEPDPLRNRAGNSIDHPTDQPTGRPAVSAGLVKFTVTQNAIAAVSKAVELSGNHALSRYNPLERHFRDVLCSRIHHPQNDLTLDLNGARALADAAL